jgi:hypothetical protein
LEGRRLLVISRLVGHGQKIWKDFIGFCFLVEIDRKRKEKESDENMGEKERKKSIFFI